MTRDPKMISVQRHAGSLMKVLLAEPWVMSYPVVVRCTPRRVKSSFNVLCNVKSLLAVEASLLVCSTGVEYA